MSRVARTEMNVSLLAWWLPWVPVVVVVLSNQWFADYPTLDSLIHRPKATTLAQLGDRTDSRRSRVLSSGTECSAVYSDVSAADHQQARQAFGRESSGLEVTCLVGDGARRNRPRADGSYQSTMMLSPW